MALYIVTGAAGFVGSQVCRILLQQGCEVVGVDDLNDAYDIRLKHHRLYFLEDYRSFRLLRLDIADMNEIEKELAFIGTPAAVLHLAARAGVRQSVFAPVACFRANVTGTVNLLEFCRRQGVKKFVFASSSSVYGAHGQMPCTEECDTSLPLSPYAASKKAAEAVCHSYHHVHGLNVSILRYFTVYGPAGRPDMSVFRFIQRIYEGEPIVVHGNGSQTRDFTYVDDVAAATVMALRSTGYMVLNVGAHCPVSIAEMIGLIEEIFGRKSLMRKCSASSSDPPATWADISKAKSTLGWQPHTYYRDGIRAACEWYVSNREWARNVLTAD